MSTKEEAYIDGDNVGFKSEGHEDFDDFVKTNYAYATQSYIDYLGAFSARLSYLKEKAETSKREGHAVDATASKEVLTFAKVLNRVEKKHLFRSKNLDSDTDLEGISHIFSKSKFNYKGRGEVTLTAPGGEVRPVKMSEMDAFAVDLLYEALRPKSDWTLLKEILFGRKPGWARPEVIWSEIKERWAEARGHKRIEQ